LTDDHSVLPMWQDLGTAGRTEEAPVVVHRYRLGLETAVSVRSFGGAWWCVPERAAGGNVAAEEWVEAGEGDGAAQAFVDLLRYEDLPSVPGFRVVRLTPPPEATGERRVDVSAGPHTGLHSSVVVGERVVVAWTRRVVDGPHPGALSLQHLAALDFMGVPEVYGLLLWCSPSGHEVPVAAATHYLPRSRDGWAWTGELVDVAAGLSDAPSPVGTPPGGIDLSAAELPARLGRLVAKLHVALASPSAVVHAPAALADAVAVLAWHAEARVEVEAASKLLLGRGSAPGARSDAAAVLDPRELPGMLAAVDELGHLAADVQAGRARVTVQRAHGDLHVGRVLRWTRGLAVVGFDAEPSFGPRSADVRTGHQPASRDLARLLASLAEVARQASLRPGMPPGAPAAWYRTARDQVAAAYRSELTADKRTELLDERLLTGFEAAERAHALTRLARADVDAQPSPLR
jgi:maltokinase